MKRPTRTLRTVTRLTPTERAMLEHIRQAEGLDTTSDAVRFLILNAFRNETK